MNSQNSQVLKDIGDFYELHRTLSNAFPQKSGAKSYREEFKILYRLEYFEGKGCPVLLVQSAIIPHWEAIQEKYSGYFLEQPQSKSLNPLMERLNNNQICIFRLKANPVKRPPPQKNSENSSRGKTNRIPIINEQQLVEWISKKGEKEAGFKILTLKSSSSKDIFDLLIQSLPISRISTPYRFQKKKSNKKKNAITLQGVLFEGHLVITDVNKFKAKMVTGIGPGKAFGFGLLSIIPIIN